jgi:tetratricopeptide (TPR) repeat protein
MGRIEKTVFISYRRTNIPWALAIYQNLTSLGYDVFFDYLSIPSGDFEKIIIENIRGRAHFIVILTPSALERGAEPGDWLRREIEIAMDAKRNIVPLMLDSFDFSNPATVKSLTGKLGNLQRYNGLRLYSEYFFEGMERLRKQYLDVALDAVVHPVSENAREVSEEHRAAANEAKEVETSELNAQEWNEKGFVLVWQTGNPIEAIRCFSQAIHLQPDFPNTYFNRGAARMVINDYQGALEDFNEAIRLKPDYIRAYNTRGMVKQGFNDLQGALADFNEAIRLKPDYTNAYRKLDHASAYTRRGYLYQSMGSLELAVKDYEEAVRIDPSASLERAYLVNALRKQGRDIEADQQEKLTRESIVNGSEYDHACHESLFGNVGRALELLKVGLEKKQLTKEWAWRDPDLENIRRDPRFIEIVGE